MTERNPLLQHVERLIQRVEKLEPNVTITAKWIADCAEDLQGLRTLIAQLLGDSERRQAGYQAQVDRNSALSQENARLRENQNQPYKPPKGEK
jgi:hypothetical protein